MASPRTIKGEVNGTGVVSYTLPPGVFQYVQSVRVVVDNTGGGDARPVIAIAEQAGAVMATKRQGESIPAGTNGSGTWALGLADETRNAAIPTKTGVYLNATQLVAPTGGTFQWSFSTGAALLDLSNTSFPKVKATGLYAFTVRISYLDADDAGKFYNARLRVNGDVFQAQPDNGGPLISSVALSPASVTTVAHMTAGQGLDLSVLHNAAVARHFDFRAYIVKIGG